MYWINLSVCWKLDNYNILYANQDILYSCPLNSMCRCFPNETKLLEINCNEVTLYKFPGESDRLLSYFTLDWTLTITNERPATFNGDDNFQIRLIRSAMASEKESAAPTIKHA